MRYAICTLAGLMAVTACLAAHADTLTQSASTSFTDVTSASSIFDNFGINLFDPALGTLNSVTQTFTGNLIFTPDVPGESRYEISTGPILQNFFEYTGGNLDVSMTGPPQLNEYTDQFGQQHAIEFLGVTVTGGSLTSVGDVTDSYLFDYTPAATPEPSTFVLLGTGLMGVAGAVRRRCNEKPQL